MIHDSVAVAERYCVFTCCDNWFAIPALAVREVCPAPALVTVPTAAPILGGLCHLRNEFIPVVRLVESPSGARHRLAEELLVLTGARGAWGLLATRVHALEALEASHVSDYVAGEAWSAAVLGSAFYREQVVKILEPQRLYKVVEQCLNREWNAAEDGSHASARASLTS